jgi:hypothetical protein
MTLLYLETIKWPQPLLEARSSHMPFFCTPQPCRRDACYLSPGCHRQYRHICCWSWRERSFVQQEASKNRVREQHSAVDCDTREGNDQTVCQKCFFGRKVTHFANMILSGRYVRLYHTGNGLSNRASCMKELRHQMPLFRLLSSGYCH